MNDPRNNEQLAAQAQHGDQAALYALWEQVERLVYSKFRRLFYRYGPDQCAAHGVTLDDLYQEGWLAFLAAVRAYKPGGWRFTTYLNYACKNRFRAAMGTDRPRPLDMADSLDRPITSEDGTGAMSDFLPDEQAAADLEQVHERQAGEAVAHALQRGLNTLPALQIQVIRCRFYAQLTRPQTALKLGVTASQVQREESRALAALRRDAEVSRAGWAVWE